MENIRNVAKHMGTLTLQHVRRVCESEAITRVSAGENGQAVIGLIEMATVCGEELDNRSALLPLPTYFDTCIEDGIRYSMQVRVF